MGAGGGTAAAGFPPRPLAASIASIGSGPESSDDDDDDAESSCAAGAGGGGGAGAFALPSSGFHAV